MVFFVRPSVRLFVIFSLVGIKTEFLLLFEIICGTATVIVDNRKKQKKKQITVRGITQLTFSRILIKLLKKTHGNLSGHVITSMQSFCRKFQDCSSIMGGPTIVDVPIKKVFFLCALHFQKLFLFYRKVPSSGQLGCDKWNRNKSTCQMLFEDKVNIDNSWNLWWLHSGFFCSGRIPK